MPRSAHWRDGRFDLSAGCPLSGPTVKTMPEHHALPDQVAAYRNQSRRSGAASLVSWAAGLLFVGAGLSGLVHGAAAINYAGAASIANAHQQPQAAGVVGNEAAREFHNAGNAFVIGGLSGAAFMGLRRKRRKGIEAQPKDLG